MTSIQAQGLQSQDLQLQQIKENPGILPLKLGRAYVQYNSWSLIKIIDLDGISSDLEFNSKQFIKFFQKLNQFKNISIIDKIKDFRAQADYIRHEAIEKLTQLVPNKRIKRGLIDPLGSLIKVITGNLDHEDAIRYENLMSNIKTREEAISNKVTIISEMMDHIINSSKIINDNTKLFNDRINKLEQLAKQKADESLLLYTTNIFHLFINNFRSISNKLSDVETSLALSKASVLHKAIINSTEMLSLLKEISNYGNLMYSVSSKNLMNLEETFNVKTYLKDNHIKFIIDVPLVESVSFTYYKLYPLPMFQQSTNQTLIIIPDYPFLLQNETSYRHITKGCREITAQEYLCSDNNIAPYISESCIEQLLQYKQHLTKCHAQRVEIEDITIQKIEENRYILYLRHKKILTQSCGDDVTREQLRGTYILTTDTPCDISIQGLFIKGNRFRELGKSQDGLPIINLPLLPDQAVFETEVLKLKSNNLDDVQHLNYLLQKSVKSDPKLYSVKSLSIATVVLYTVFFFILTYLAYQKLKPFIDHRLTGENAAPINENSNVNEHPILIVA